MKINVYKLCFYLLTIIGCALHMIIPNNDFIQGFCLGLYYVLMFWLIIVLLGLGIVLIFRDNLIDIYSRESLLDFVETGVETPYTVFMFLLIFSLFVLSGFYTYAIIFAIIKVLNWVLDRAIESILNED